MWENVRLWRIFIKSDLPSEKEKVDLSSLGIVKFIEIMSPKYVVGRGAKYGFIVMLVE